MNLFPPYFLNELILTQPTPESLDNWCERGKGDNKYS